MVIGGRLVRVGGARNTINNIPENADYPIGAVLTGVAWPSNEVILVTGTLTATTDAGSYTLSVSAVLASVIKQGETGDPFWAAELAGTASIGNLTITVAASTCDTDADCYDADPCTSNACIGVPGGTCASSTIPSRPYANVYPNPDGDGAVEIMDTLCILDAAGGVGGCTTNVGGFTLGDIYPCPPPEGAGPDGAVEIMDTLSVLDAAGGNPGCVELCE